MASLTNVLVDICKLVGYSEDDITIGEGLSGNVKGYTIANRSSARSLIEVLQQAYNFTTVESGDKIKFVSLDTDPVQDDLGADVVIEDDDLVAISDGDNSANFVEVGIEDEEPLPKTLSLNYVSKGANYQQGTQEAIRQIADFGEAQTVTLPVVFDETEARQIAERLLYSQWVERTTFRFATTIKHLNLEPGDIVKIAPKDRNDVVTTFIVRIIRKQFAGQRIVWEAVLTDTSVFTQVIDAENNVVPQPLVRIPDFSKLALLDVPLLRDVDDGAGFYIGVNRLGVNWDGATVFRAPTVSSTSFSALTNVSSPTITGTITSGAMPVADPNTTDISTEVTVVLDFTADTLQDIELGDLYAGGNLAAVGNIDVGYEIINFRTAEQTAEGTYILRELLRGQLGTEDRMAANALSVGPFDFVLLDGTGARISDGQSAIGSRRPYKGVTSGQSIGDVASIEFTNTARGLLPWAPAQLSAISLTDAAEYVTDISWQPRSRFGGGWIDLVDAPVQEAVEEYILTIGSREETVTGARTFRYDAAMRTADGVSIGDTLQVTVEQVSAVVGRGVAATLTIVV